MLGLSRSAIGTLLIHGGYERDRAGGTNRSRVAEEVASPRRSLALGITCDTLNHEMNSVSIRDLRHHGGEAVDRASRGEKVTITRAGQAVAELRPLASPPLSAEVLLARWRRLPDLDSVALRADIDETLNARL